MKIFDQRPSDTSFKENEIKSCQQILNRGFFLSDFSDLNSHINTFVQRYLGVDYDVTPLKFHADFSMEIEGHLHKVFVGANIMGANGINSYFFAVCDKEEKELIRKFHFDYAPPTITPEPEQKVPVYHLQYGGKTTDEIKELKIQDTKLESGLSLPRLNYTPINLALLLDLLLCEFRVLETDRIVEDPHWRSIIFNNEDFLLRHHITCIYEHINSTQYSSKYLLRDYFYGQ